MPGNVASVTIGSPSTGGGRFYVGVSGGGRCFTLFFLQGGPLLVINGVITLINGLIIG